MADAYDFTFDSITGGPLPLATFKDHPILVVNVASKCGLTPQYEGLEKLYKTYKDQGLVVLGVPCNQFMGQEPGSEADIVEFCTTNFGVDFPMTAKVDVKGEGAHPFYKWAKEVLGDGAEPIWNFQKILVGKSGEPLQVFDPRTDPMDPAITSAIEKAL